MKTSCLVTKLIRLTVTDKGKCLSIKYIWKVKIKDEQIDTSIVEIRYSEVVQRVVWNC